MAAVMSGRRNVRGALSAPLRSLPRCLPATAARYACRSPIPLSRSGVTAELAVCIRTVDRDLHKALASNAAGYVRARAGNLTVGHGQGRASGRFTTSGAGDDRDLPQPVIGRLGQNGSSQRSGEKRGKNYRGNAIAAHESDPHIWVIGAYSSQM